MSKKPLFGKDVNEFLRRHGENVVDKCEKALIGASITALVPTNGEKTVVRVTVSNPSGRENVEFLLMREHVQALSLSVGAIDEELLPELEYYAEVARAYSSACASFAFTQSSLRALWKKILQKGFPGDVCDEAIACVRSRGFVDEQEIALRRAQICVGKHWGRSRVLMKLREEGFEGDCVSRACAYLTEIDFVEICVNLIEKKFGGVPEDRHEREKLCASLTRMGHSPADIRRAMSLCSKS